MLLDFERDSEATDFCAFDKGGALVGRFIQIEG
jgi:hypothetical protein